MTIATNTTTNQPRSNRGPSPVTQAIFAVLDQILCRPLTMTIKSEELDKDVTFTGHWLAGPSPNDHGVITRVANIGDEAIMVIWYDANSGTYAPTFFPDLEAFLAFKNVTEKMKAQVVANYDKEEIDLAEMCRTEAFLDGFWEMSPADATDQG